MFTQMASTYTRNCSLIAVAHVVTGASRRPRFMEDVKVRKPRRSQASPMTPMTLAAPI
jgi:hypothetical protein